MKKAFFFLSYNFLFLPVVYILAHIGALFHPKLRHGILKRHLQWKELSPAPGKKTILFHTASLGEYEHIRPLFKRIKQQHGDSVFLVNMFFSPSGYLHTTAGKEADKVIYAPFDTPWAVWRIFRKLKPSLLVIAKHDVWPNQIMIAEKMKIPTMLINASMSEDSSRLKWWSRGIHRFLYGHIGRIYTISATDKNNFLRLVDPDRLRLVGDTKFDQVIIRKEQNADRELLPEKFWKKKRVFVMGSIWPADFEILGPALRKILPDYPDLRLLFVPHEPNAKHIAEITDLFPVHRLYTQKDHYSGEKVMIVDTIGVLADLYKYAYISFVGGGNKEGVHNVMEAAVYGVPVLYGPVLGGSNEAREMASKGEGGTIIRDSASFEKIFRLYLDKPEAQKKDGTAALNFVMQRLGASDQIIEEINRAFKSNPA